SQSTSAVAFSRRSPPTSHSPSPSPPAPCRARLPGSSPRTPVRSSERAQHLRHRLLVQRLPLSRQHAVAVLLGPAHVPELFGGGRVVDVAVRVAGDESELVR